VIFTLHHASELSLFEGKQQVL